MEPTNQQRRDGEAPPAGGLGPENVRAAAAHLKWVVGGVTLCAVGVLQVWGSEGHLWRIAPSAALAGWLMILVGVARLARIRVDDPWRDRYGSAMRVVKWVAILGVARAASDQLPFERPGTVKLFLAILGLAQLAAAVLLGICMRRLCLRAGVGRGARAWSVFLAIFMGFYAIPVAFYNYSAYATQLGGQTYRYDPVLLSVAGASATAVIAGALAWAVWRTARGARDTPSPHACDPADG